MRGDFSKGFSPDRRRGARFRRVLMQQGRMLLDSDVNALVDAQDALHRNTLSDLGCRAGSPDYGFLVTPGRLLRLFDDPDGLADIDPGGLDIHRAFAERYLGRYPSLYLQNFDGPTATATIPLRQPTSASRIRLWVKGGGQSAAGGVFQDVAGISFEPNDIVVNGTVSEIQVRLSAGQQLWIGLIEEHQSAGTRPAFWIADGVFHLDGLRLTADSSNLWSTASLDVLLVDELAGEEQPGFMPGTGMLPPANVAAGRLVAYLEGWERHLTAAEDPGIREVALGQRLDTCTRTQALGQVKVAPVAAGTTPETVLQAFANVQRGDGRLEIEVASSGLSDANDPCSLPTLDGYTGADNRLYRIEVHEVTNEKIVLKWSRDNGSQLYPVRKWSPTELRFSADNSPEGGDLVEILSEAVALGDQGAAVLDTAMPSFTPPVRQVGELVALNPTSTKGSFSIPALAKDYGGAGAALRARVWHRIEDDRTGQWHTLGDGLTFKLTGTPQVGDYWEYTARVGTDGDPRWATGARAPDGPERLFTPLALLEVPATPQDDPLELISWLDHRFPRMCELEAGDIPFDGSAVGQDDSTVQEVLERLLDHEEVCCCEVTLEPADEDLSTRIPEAIAGISGPVAICLQPGIYPIRSTFTVTNRRITLKGCPDAVLVDEVANAAPLVVATGGLLELVDVTVVSSTGSTGNAIVQVAMDARGVRCRGAGLLAGRADVIAIRVGNPAPKVPRIAAWQSSGERILAGEPPATSGKPEVELEECVIAATWGIAAESLSGLRDRGSHMEVFEGGVFAVAAAGVDLQRTAIDDGYDPANYGALLDPVDLDFDPDPILDALAESNPNFGGVGLAFGTLQGRIEQCIVRTGIGLYAEQATTLETCSNQWLGVKETTSTHGIYLRTAIDTLLLQERITSHVGIYVPDLARNMEIRGCRLECGSHGVVIGRKREVDEAEITTVEQVTIASNIIEVDTNGILFGPAEEMRIHDNALTAGDYGTGIQGRALRDDLTRFTVFITNNCITGCYRGISAEGANLHIQRNAVTMKNILLGIGIRVTNCNGLLCDGNVVIIPGPSAGVWAFVFERCHGRGGRVSGNTVHAAAHNRGVFVIDAHNFYFCNNSLEYCMAEFHSLQGLMFADNYLGEEVTISESWEELILIGNYFEKDVNINDSSPGSIQGNHIAGQDGYDTSLQISLSQGIDNTPGWMVENNRTAGWIRILPAYSSFMPTLRANHSAEVDLGAKRANIAESIDIDARTVDQRMRKGASTQSDFLNENWKDQTMLELDRQIDSIFLREWMSELDVVVEFAPAHLGYEYPYEARVSGNWCQGLQVGYRSPSATTPNTFGLDTATPRSNSRIQVINNRAKDGIAVNRYSHRIVAYNVAGDYDDISVSSTASVSHNTKG